MPSHSSSSTGLPPLLCLNRIKVTFRDEQGEGSGVARSFYTAFCEAALADLPLPASLDAAYHHSTALAASSSAGSLGHLAHAPFTMLQRYRSARNLDAARRHHATSVPSTPTNANGIAGMLLSGAAASRAAATSSSLRARDATPADTREHVQHSPATVNTCAVAAIICLQLQF
jgi:hypothetical protein